MAPASTEQSFRANLSQFRWAQSSTQQPAAPSQPSNPFSRFYSSVTSDYIPLRSSETNNEDEAWFALNRWERLLGFGGCLLGAAVCFFVSFLTLPLLAIRTHSFSAVYFGSLGLTLYFALGAHSYLGSLVCGAVQVVALVAYVLAYFPGGSQTLRLGGSLALRGAGSLLPR
ncbi:hypothetical protein BDQ17DRAFT_1351150 [Cyathus striatus]|nr:hypothetical protein BDQ17DRAFT_1351150 [Cyathus striatus]